jgi:hypothetical protein
MSIVSVLHGDDPSHRHYIGVRHYGGEDVFLDLEAALAQHVGYVAPVLQDVGDQADSRTPSPLSLRESDSMSLDDDYDVLRAPVFVLPVNEWSSKMLATSAEFVQAHTLRPDRHDESRVHNPLWAQATAENWYRAMCHDHSYGTNAIGADEMTSVERADMLIECLKITFKMPKDATRLEMLDALRQGVRLKVVLPAGKDCAQAPWDDSHQDHTEQEPAAAAVIRALRAQHTKRTKHSIARSFPRRSSKRNYDEDVYSWCISESLRDLRAAQRAGVDLPGLGVLALLREEDIWKYAGRYIWIVDSNNPMKVQARNGEVEAWINEDQIERMAHNSAAFALKAYDPARLLVEQEAGRRGGLKSRMPKKYTDGMIRAVAHLSIRAATAALGCARSTLCARRAELRAAEQWDRALAAKAATGRTGPRVARKKVSVPLIVGELDLRWLDRVRGGREVWRFGARQRARMALFKT